MRFGTILSSLTWAVMVLAAILVVSSIAQAAPVAYFNYQALSTGTYIYGGWASGINDAGDIVGGCSNGLNKGVAVAWWAGQYNNPPVVIGTFTSPNGAVSGSAMSINNARTVVGYADGAGFQKGWIKLNNKAYTWLPSTNGWANVVNSVGDVVGQQWKTNGNSAVVWPKGGSMRTLPLLSGHTSGEAYCISDTGIIVGRSNTTGVFWKNYVIAGQLASTNSRIMGISPNGKWICGWLDGGAFIWDGINPPRKDVCGPNGYGYGWAMSVNDNGELAGYSRSQIGDASYSYTSGYFWSAESGMVELPRPPNCYRTWATRINSKGQVLGYAVESGGKQIPVLWTPVRK